MPEVVQHIIDVGPGSGVQVHIAGGDGDIIYVYRDGTLIGNDGNRDGQNLTPADVAWVNAGTGGNDFNIAVRRGSDRDIFFCIAVRGNDVYENPSAIRYRVGKPDNGYYPFRWIDAGTLEVRADVEVNFVKWNAAAKKWDYTET